MNWHIPDLEPYVTYFVKELFRWFGDNQYTLYLSAYILRELKVQAMKSKNVVDDSIITLLIYLVSFKWLTSFRKPGQEDESKP